MKMEDREEIIALGQGERMRNDADFIEDEGDE